LVENQAGAFGIGECLGMGGEYHFLRITEF